MTSEPAASEAFVWVWLPNATEPVVCGRLEQRGEVVVFNYGRSYLARAEAISLYEPELPLVRGIQRPLAGLAIAACISDAGPDGWGQRVILRRRGPLTAVSDVSELSRLTYLLESGSDRIGAIDFQQSSETYVARSGQTSLDELVTAADRIQAGEPLSPALEVALVHGTSIGGARPKVTLVDGDTSMIAKLSSATDPYPVVKAEALAMNLARRVGLDVATTRMTTSLGRDVLLVERFDRPAAGRQRRLMISALTILGLDELAGRYATYYELADVIRARFTRPEATLRELFARIVFNICVGNSDDHARNHAAFWDGEMLTLTPAYDICPQVRSGQQAAQAMAFSENDRVSQLAACVRAAPHYLLERADAQDIVEHQVSVIREQREAAADVVGLSRADRELLWERQILNPFIFQDAGSP